MEYSINQRRKEEKELEEEFKDIEFGFKQAT